ncbi:hypothetical protein AQUCO_06400048v1 [Aquilegia coerulea]|uniref:NADH-quinone oxidoreductase subunit D domain-containing protein n=1 Tax=Aquilegia coerulea TaxID=218851 RepID=A0A2G5CDU1_AQUCA|nr:hypothetical protein AQUCO_06400048v1 [Aquilegia coerulea]
MLELSRISSHLLWLGPFMADIGAQTPFFYIFREREFIYDLFESATGMRMMHNYFHIGGVAADLPYGWIDKCLDFCDYFLTGVTEYQKLITRNPIFWEQVEGVGTLCASRSPQWGIRNFSDKRSECFSVEIENSAARFYQFANSSSAMEAIHSFSTQVSLKEVYELIWLLFPIFTTVFGIIIGVLVILWLERQITTGVQQRIGPEYTGPWGILQALADGTKLLFKEDLRTSRGDIRLFSIRPSIAVISILLSYLVIPFGYRLVLSDLSIGVFLWIAISSIAPIGLLMSGYGSNNKYSFLGGLRAAAQSISYEIPLTPCVLSISLRAIR